MVAGCKQKMAEGLMSFVCNPTLTYGKKAPFWIFGNIADTRGNFNPNLLLFWILALQPFWIFSNMAASAVILN